MSEQYFTSNPQSKSDPMTWTFTLKGNELTFTSDYGVFSKKEVDFGSRTLIDAFSLPNVQGDILDLGCGYGPVGIAIAKSFSERKVVFTDINERALQLAEKNALQNNLNNVEFKKSDSLESFPNRKFSAILLNPPIRAGKKTIYRMFDDSHKALAHDGELWVVIQKKQGAPSAQKKLEDLFGSVSLVTKNKGYYILCAKNIDV